MSDTSARYALPWLQPGQAQKEMFHNEALAILDMALHPVVEAVDAVTPPAAPAIGQGWALGASPGGAWAGQGYRLAAWTEGGWRFVVPVTGMTLWSRGDGLPVRWTGTGWTIGTIAAARVTVGGVQVIGARQPAIAAPAGGAAPDAEGRAEIGAVLAALRAHGLIAT